MQNQPEINVRGLARPPALASLLTAFDRLRDHQMLVLTGDESLRHCIDDFRAARGGKFFWSMLELGPSRFRAVLYRRAPDAPPTAAEFLDWDHSRLALLMVEARTLAERKQWPQARERFAEFRCGLARHMAVEEEVLYPVFEKATSMSEKGPTALMRHEHALIHAWLENLTGLLVDEAADAFASGHASMLTLLGRHLQREASLAAPCSDSASDAAGARGDLAEQLLAL